MNSQRFSHKIHQLICKQGRIEKNTNSKPGPGKRDAFDQLLTPLDLFGLTQLPVSQRLLLAR